MSGIGIIWEYGIQYGNTKPLMVTNFPYIEYKARCQNNVRDR